MYDERNLRVDPDRIEHVVKLYRQLTINYEQAKSYQLAGEFHYSAMEVQRTFLGVPRKTLKGFWLSLGSRIWRWLRRNIFSLLAWYHHLCGYGERPVQVILVWCSMVLLVTVLLMLIGLSNDFGEALRFSFRAATLRVDLPEVKNPTATWLLTFTSVLGPVQIALFILALQRRFRR